MILTGGFDGFDVLTAGFDGFDVLTAGFDVFVFEGCIINDSRF